MAYDFEVVSLMNRLSQPSKKSLTSRRQCIDPKRIDIQFATACCYFLAVAGDTPRFVVHNHGDLRLRIMYKYHATPVGGHRGREKAYLTV